MKCPKCSRAIDSDSIYCSYCGIQVTQNIMDTISSDSNIMNLLAHKCGALAAVKYCAEQYDMGLKEAKDIIDRIRKKI